MYKYQITKYNPDDRDENGHYKRHGEWTDFDQVGTLCEGSMFTLQDYEKVESAYLDVAESFLKESGVQSLHIYGLKYYDSIGQFREGDVVNVNEIRPLLKSVLRCEMFAQFESRNCYIHFGMDYYMFIGVEEECHKSKEMASRLGLYVERSRSPYEHLAKYRYIDKEIDVVGLIETWWDGMSDEDKEILGH